MHHVHMECLHDPALEGGLVTQSTGAGAAPYASSESSNGSVDSLWNLTTTLHAEYTSVFSGFGATSAPQNGAVRAATAYSEAPDCLASASSCSNISCATDSKRLRQGDPVLEQDTSPLIENPEGDREEMTTKDIPTRCGGGGGIDDLASPGQLQIPVTCGSGHTGSFLDDATSWPMFGMDPWSLGPFGQNLLMMDPEAAPISIVWDHDWEFAGKVWGSTPLLHEGSCWDVDANDAATSLVLASTASAAPANEQPSLGGDSMLIDQSLADPAAPKGGTPALVAHLEAADSQLPLELPVIGFHIFDGSPSKGKRKRGAESHDLGVAKNEASSPRKRHKIDRDHDSAVFTSTSHGIIGNGSADDLVSIRETASVVPRTAKTKATPGKAQFSSGLALEKPRIKSWYNTTTGEFHGSIINFGNEQRGRRKFTSEEKTQLLQTRAVGACRMCRMKKKKCAKLSEYDACHLCLTSSVSLATFCFRHQIDEAQLHRKHTVDFKWTNRELYTIAENHVCPHDRREVELTQGMQGHHIKVSVARFKLEEGDRTSYPYMDGDGKGHNRDTPNFLIDDMNSLRCAMHEYYKKCRKLYVSTLAHQSNEILRDTFKLACDAAENKPLVHQALELWTLTRFIERTWFITGKEKLEMSRGDPKDPWEGEIPVPTLMDPQLDGLVLGEMLGSRAETLLKGIDGKIQARKREDWFEIYLALFVLLNNFEVTNAHARRLAKMRDLKGRYGPSYYNNRYFHAAKILLSYFHYVFTGQVPIALNWKRKNTGNREWFDAFSKTEIKHIKEIQGYIRLKEPDLRELRSNHRYESPLYWCHQLWFPDWHADSTIREAD